MGENKNCMASLQSLKMHFLGPPPSPFSTIVVWMSAFYIISNLRGRLWLCFIAPCRLMVGTWILYFLIPGYKELAIYLGKAVTFMVKVNNTLQYKIITVSISKLCLNNSITLGSFEYSEVHATPQPSETTSRGVEHRHQCVLKFHMRV